jgi:RNA polymerase sigma-70 factor (ECF subfamily)
VAIDRAIHRQWSAADRAAWKVSVTPDQTDNPHARVPSIEDRDRLEDSALVDASLAGDREAFDVLVRRHQRHVYQLCYRFAGNHEDASDLAQDAFIRAYRGLRSFKGTSAFSTWLYRIAVNVCLNHVGSRATRDVIGIAALDSPDTRIEPPDVALVRGERAAEVRAAIAGLPRKQRAAVILRVYHELPHEAIAEILGSSVGAVKANFFYALANLRKALRVTP